jgi:hypothetical protein
MWYGIIAAAVGMGVLVWRTVIAPLGQVLEAAEEEVSGELGACMVVRYDAARVSDLSALVAATGQCAIVPSDGQPTPPRG